MSTCLRIVSAFASMVLASILILGVWFWGRDDLGASIAISTIAAILVLYGVTEVYRAGRIEAREGDDSAEHKQQVQRSSRHIVIACALILLVPLFVLFALADYSRTGSFPRIALIAFVIVIIFGQALWNFWTARRIMRDKYDT